MPRTGQDNERTEQAPHRKRKQIKVEPLHQQVENLDEKYNNLAKFPSENPYPVLRIHKDGTLLYANKASEALLKAKEAAVGLPAPPEWQQPANNALSSGQVMKYEITFNERVFAFMVVPIIESDYVNFYGTDITEQKIAQEEREITIKLLSLINSRNPIHDLMKLVTSLLRDWSGCEAVGIRLRDGEDFPYFETSGFSDEFLKTENKLCSVNELGEPIRDSQGRVFLECMCGNIISGRFDPTKPFFTEHGSFWTNSTTALLAGTTSADRLAKTRNYCNTVGYESVSLVPLRTGKETFGLLQFNSRQKNKFTPDKIKLFERLADNLSIGLAQRKTEEALRESETRFRTLFEETIDGMLLADSETKTFHTANSQICRMLGYNEEELKLLSVSDLHPAESLPRVLEAFAAQANGDIQTAFEVPVRRKDGSIFYADISAKPFSMAGRRYMLGIFHDTTERKKMQEAILREQKLSEKLINSSIDGIHAYDHQCRYVIWNPAMERISGMKKDDVLGRCAFDVFPFLKETDSDKYFYDALAGKTVIAKNRPYKIPKTGQQGFFDGHYAPLYDERNNIIGGLAVIHDVTERKRADESLKKSEDKFSKAFKATPEAVTIASLEDGRYIDINDVFLEVTGFQRDEVIGHTSIELNFWADIDKRRQYIEELTRTGSLKNFDVQFRMHSGKIRDFLVSSEIIELEGKKCSLNFILDITERKRAENALQESEAKYRRIVDTANEGIWMLDTNNIAAFVNNRMAEMLGYQNKDIVGRHVEDFMFEDDRPDHHKKLENRRRGMSENYERRFRHKDGHTVWTLVSGMPIFDTELRFGGSFGMFTDITERKRAEEAMLVSETRYRRLFEAARDGILILDAESGLIVDVNPFIENILGYSHKEFLDKYLWEIGLFKDIVASKEALLELQTKGYVRYENLPLKTKDGRHIAVEFVSNVYLVDHTKVIQCNIHDITERARVEESLQNSETRFRELFNNMSSGVAVYETVDDGADFVFRDFNASGQKMEKISLENVIGRRVTEVFPGVKEMGLIDVFRRVWKTGKAEYFPTSFYKDGRISRWRENQVYKLPSGEIVAIYDDVTERQTAQEKLREERNLLRTLIDHIPDGIYVKDTNSRFILYNKAVAEYWGDKGKTELMGKTDFDILPQKTAQNYFDEERKVMSTNQPLVNREGTCADDSGQIHHFLTTKIPLRDTHGTIAGIVGVNHEITAIKIFESKLLDYQKQLKRLASRLMTVEEQERRRIAGELHDEVSQILAMAKIKLDILRNSPQSEMSTAKIEEISNLVEKVIQETRELTFELSNPILYELGFEAAVGEWLDENIQKKHGIATEFHDDELSKPLDDDLKAMLFRNVRELLTNCIKHARADKISIGLRRIDDSIEVTVEDNGVGFDPAQVWTKTGKKVTYGLFSIRENMENTGGSFKIESKPGAGCKAAMVAPLKNQSDKKEV